MYAAMEIKCSKTDQQDNYIDLTLVLRSEDPWNTSWLGWPIQEKHSRVALRSTRTSMILTSLFKKVLENMGLQEVKVGKRV
jgi:hypothetical protein